MQKLHNTDMQDNNRPMIDWWRVSPRTMTKVMELSDKHQIPPTKAFRLMVKNATKRKMNPQPTKKEA